MTDQRTMRTFLDLVTERDEALGAATDLAEQAELTMLELRYAEFVHDVLRDCLRAADAERDEALGEATRLADLLADCETLATHRIDPVGIHIDVRRDHIAPRGEPT